MNKNITVVSELLEEILNEGVTSSYEEIAEIKDDSTAFTSLEATGDLNAVTTFKSTESKLVESEGRELFGVKAEKWVVEVGQCESNKELVNAVSISIHHSDNKRIQKLFIERRENVKKIKLLVDSKAYKEKPRDVGNLSDRIVQHQREVTPEEMAELFGKGHTLVLSTMKRNQKRNKDNMKQQQALALDFDNTEVVKLANGKTKKVKTEGMLYQSIEETLEDAFIKDHAAFIYKTFSHTDDWEHFRVVFILDKPLTSNEAVEGAYKYLMDKFPTADKANKDSSRLFYGGTEATEIDFNNELPVAMFPEVELEVVKPKTRKQIQKAMKSIPKGEKATWELIQEGNYEEAKERLGIYSVRLHSKLQASTYIKDLPMSEVLGLPKGTFKDIFHEENTPSAGTYQLPDSGTWMYKCHSSSAPYDGDILKVVGDLTDTGYFGGRNLLIDLMGITIEESDRIREMQNYWSDVQQVLLSESFKENFPDVHKRFRYYKTEINALIEIFKQNIWEMEDGTLKSLTYLSVGRLAKMLYGTDNESKQKTVKKILNLMSYTDWIDKLDPTVIPPKLYTHLKNYQNKQGYKRHANVFELVRQDDDFFNRLNTKCVVMDNKDLKTVAISKEGLELTDGKEEADRIFVQDKKREVSKETLRFYEALTHIIKRHVAEHGYIEQNELLRTMVEDYGYGKTYTTNTYKKVLPKLLEEQGYTKKRLTKNLREQWGLSSSQSSPTILYAS